MRGTCDRILGNSVAGREVARHEIYPLARRRDAHSGRMKRFEDRQVRNSIAYIFLIVVDDEVVSLGSGGSAFQDHPWGWVQSVEQSFGN